VGKRSDPEQRQGQLIKGVLDGAAVDGPKLGCQREKEAVERDVRPCGEQAERRGAQTLRAELTVATVEVHETCAQVVGPAEFRPTVSGFVRAP
jgi:hypothetical protein